MASKQSVRKPYLLTCVLLVFTWITDGVKIEQKTFTSVTVRDTEEVVTLPCNFITSPYEAPVITWLWYTDKDTRQVTRFENQQLFSQKEFSNRVARGDKGALVLIRPTLRDSGNYSCEVQVEKENPRFAIAFIMLAVRPSRTEVTIPKVHRQVKAEDTDTSVTLPCDFTTDGPAIPQIIWRLFKKGYTQDIGKFNNDSSLSMRDQFVGRVARGNRGDLVLIAPRVEDSGTYNCTIQVDKGQLVAADVKLSVSSNSDANVVIPFQSAGLEVLICILWIIPVFCGFDPEGWKYIVAFVALCLIFSGTVSSVKALSSRDQTGFNYKRAVGYGTGITGIVILCGVHTFVALTKLCRVKCSSKDTTEKSCDNADVEKTDDSVKTADDCEERPEQEQVNLIPRAGGNKTNGADYTVAPNTCEPSAVKDVKEPKIRTFVFPNIEKITWMTSVSASVAYFTTQGSLHRLDFPPESNLPKFTLVFERGEQLLMMSKHKQGLLLLAKQLGKKNVSRDSYDKYTLLSVGLENKMLYKVHLEHRISFVLSEPHSEDVHMIYPKTQHITKAVIKGEKFHNSRVLKTRVLKKPSCIVKNSREQIIVTDSVKDDVFVFDEDTGLVTSMKISVTKDLEPGLQGCNRLAVGPDDRIYVTGPFTRNVFVFGADFRFERVIETGTETSGQISCLMIHANSLYVAHSNCISLHPLPGN